MHVHVPELPVADPVLFFAIAALLFLVVPPLFERLGLPGLVGLILVGAVIGPNGTGLLERGPAMVLLATIGLIYLMFMVGLELDLEQFRRHRRHSLEFGLASFLLPLVIGVGLGLLLGYGGGEAALIGAVLSSHTLVAYPVAGRLGILKTPAVTTVLGATLLTDMLALLVLAVVAGIHRSGLGLGFWLGLGGSIVGYGVVVMWGVPRLSRWFFRRMGGDVSLEFVFTMVVLFASCALSQSVGIEPIIGALVTGLALNRFIPEHSALMSRIRFAADTLFVPFFLVSVGMLVDVRAFAHPDEWVAIGALIAGVLVSKWLAVVIVQRHFHFKREDGWVMFGLTSPHAAGSIAIVLVAYRLHRFDLDIVNAVVILVLVTCMVGPWVVSRWGRKVALREEQRGYEPTAAPTRILVPISNPASRDGLIDLAMLLRRPDSDQPILPLMVVREDGAGTEANVAEAERMLSHAVLRAAAGSVPVTPLTRVDYNIAGGIARGVAESRASAVVIGWDHRGSVLDQLLERTRVRVMVAHLSQPLNAVTRLVLVLPPFVNRNPGFVEAAHTVKVLAQQLSAPIEVLVVGDAVEPFERALGRIKPDAPVSFRAPSSWSNVHRDLAAGAEPDDLVVLMSAREGTLAWSPRLRRLTRLVSGTAGNGSSVLVIYPGEPEDEARPGVGLAPSERLAAGLSDYLSPSRVVNGLDGLELEPALGRILDSEFQDRPVQRDVILQALLDQAREDSTELKPGVVVPHVRVAGVSEPILFLGLADRGVPVPHASEPARHIFVLVSPREPADAHLRALAAVARASSDEEGLAELLARAGGGPRERGITPA